MKTAKETALLGLTFEELSRLAEDFGQPPYRARQLFEALYASRLESIGEITTLPGDFRERLSSEGFWIGQPGVAGRFLSSDGTVRYLMALAGQQTVESVWMPSGDDGESGDGSEAGEAREPGVGGKGRATICVSSQVGCAVGCEFCLTAALGMKRNLTAGEIVGQVTAVLRDQGVFPPRDRINLVFMGMGEPFLNYDSFMGAVRLLVAGVGIPESRMTVSTAGVVPRIYDLGREAVRPKLAISLNAPSDALRSQIMPINRKWNLEKLMAAARDFPLRAREKLTFEYVLLQGVNDSPQHARQLSALIAGVRAKVNLIALNPGPGLAFGTPLVEAVEDFRQILLAAGVPAFLRRPRGRDIYAACGQLKRTLELDQRPAAAPA